MIYDDIEQEKRYIQRIRELREDHDFSQQYVADFLCTSQTMYARYERDASAMPIRHLIYLSKLYKVSTDYILGLTDIPLPASRLCHDEAAATGTKSDDRYNIRWRTTGQNH